MTPERWAQVRQVFDTALERNPPDREAYLRVTCAGDDDLRHEVDSLLASHERAADFLTLPFVSPDDTLGYGDDNPADYPEGYRIGPYELRRRIARGGMGAVYEAVRVDHEYHQTVAVKLVRRGMDSHEILRRFRVERQMLASLDHPNIARLIDGGSTPEGLPYLVMEYVNGIPVDEYCNRGKLTITDRLKLFRAVCSAVQYAHQKLIVHRDLKPGNILVTAEGTPKLLDFGIAKVLNPELSTMQLSTTELAQTLPNLRPMTPDYASPEQVRGEAVTTSADVYSLGVLLYKLLTGKRPYASVGRSPGAIQKAILEMEPPKPSAVALTDEKTAVPQSTIRLEAVTETREKSRKRLQRKLSGDLDTIVLKALRKDPLERYASVEQFSEDIRRYLEGRPIRAGKFSLRYRLVKFVRRNRLSVAVTTLATLALIGVAVVSVNAARLARADRDRAERHFRDAQRLVHFVLDELDAPGPGDLTSARKAVAERSRDYLDRLKPDAARDPALAREIGEAYVRLGGIQAESQDSAGALASYREAARLFDRLSAAGFPDAGILREVIEVNRKTGLEERRAGDLLGALARFSRYLENAQALVELETRAGRIPSVGTQRNVALAYRLLGEVLVKNGAREEGLAQLRKAVGAEESIAAAHPADPDARPDLASALDALALAYEVCGDKARAVETEQKALALMSGAPQAELRKELEANLARMRGAR